MAGPDLFSVPRRFDLFTVLVATTGYALLFTGLRLLDYSPTVLAVAGGLFAAVAIGQAAIRGVSPRRASVIAAIVYWMIILVANALLTLSEPNVSHRAFERVISAIVLGPIFGLLTGYFVGVLDAGVFLISHHLRSRWRSVDHGADPGSPWEEHPLDAALPAAATTLAAPPRSP